MLGLFRKKKSLADISVPTVDLHSHLLPGLDDGVKSAEESLRILKSFEALGYKKVITTPHVMSDFYKNTFDGINKSLRDLKSEIASETDIQIEAAAEYYLDETFLAMLEDDDSEILKIGGRFILFETGFLDEPAYLKKTVFKIQSMGFKALLAHPERYQYLISDWEAVEDLRNRSVYFQLNLNSLTTFYSKPVQKMSRKLIDAGYVDFVGSDCHNELHFEVMKEALLTKDFQRLQQLKLLNDSLL